VLKYSAIDILMVIFLHTTIEKTLGIAISLSLCLGIGVPLLNIAFDSVNDYQRYNNAVELMNKIDQGINFVIDNNLSCVEIIILDENILIWSENNSIFCKFSEISDSLIQQEYSYNITLIPPTSSGEQLMYIYIKNSFIIIEFLVGA
jgi:hypothetical protein